MDDCLFLESFTTFATLSFFGSCCQRAAGVKLPMSIYCFLSWEAARPCIFAMSKPLAGDTAFGSAVTVAATPTDEALFDASAVSYFCYSRCFL